MQTTNNKQKLAMIWVALGALGRLIPHLPNFTPNASLALFGGSKLGHKTGLFVTLLSLILSDILLEKIHGYPVFGLWTLFTFSGFFFLVLAGKWLGQSAKAGRTLLFILGGSFGFWLWTNFGVWIAGELYPKNISGLGACYLAGLPFLRNALLGDLVWGLVIFASFAKISHKSPERISA